jgi:hypothetical protein
VVLTRAARAAYQERLDDHLRALEQLAARTQSVYARLPSDGDVHTFVAVELPRVGVLTRR